MTPERVAFFDLGGGFWAELSTGTGLEPGTRIWGVTVAPAANFDERDADPRNLNDCEHNCVRTRRAAEARIRELAQIIQEG
jgi:hypothetical protein